MYFLPQHQKEIIDRYFTIKFGPHVIPCPYYMNKRGEKFQRPVFVGKGTPDEIEQQLRDYYAKKAHTIKDAVDAVNVMKLLNLGIDCSGFIVNVLGLGAGIKYPNVYLKLRAWFSPRTRISADLLTGALNATPVALSDVKPGDLIRRGKSHVMLVEWVDSNRLGYVHSSTRPLWGMQRGEIEIIDSSKGLEDQRWSVSDDLETYKRSIDDKGLRRLKKI